MTSVMFLIDHAMAEIFGTAREKNFGEALT
jgi:hypothetical protein